MILILLGSLPLELGMKFGLITVIKCEILIKMDARRARIPANVPRSQQVYCSMTVC
jgi:hypothetical protein